MLTAQLYLKKNIQTIWLLGFTDIVVFTCVIFFSYSGRKHCREYSTILYNNQFFMRFVSDGLRGGLGFVVNYAANGIHFPIRNYIQGPQVCVIIITCISNLNSDSVFVLLRYYIMHKMCLFAHIGQQPRYHCQITINKATVCMNTPSEQFYRHVTNVKYTQDLSLYTQKFFYKQ